MRRKQIIEVFRIKSGRKRQPGSQHLVCPVCKFHKTFAGACCDECTSLGYKLRGNKLRRSI